MKLSSPFSGSFIHGIKTAGIGAHNNGKFTPRRFPLRRAAGFTLVEVVLAIGIIAFAFIPLLGLLPLGLDVSRQAIDATVQAQIAQQLTTQAQQTDFSLLSSLDGKTYYFDDQGNTSTSSGSNIYEAALSVKTGTPLPGQITTQKLATVTISVLSLTSTQGSKSITDPTKKYVVLIPDNGR